MICFATPNWNTFFVSYFLSCALLWVARSVASRQQRLLESTNVSAPLRWGVVATSCLCQAPPKITNLNHPLDRLTCSKYGSQAKCFLFGNKLCDWLCCRQQIPQLVCPRQQRPLKHWRHNRHFTDRRQGNDFLKNLLIHGQSCIEAWC